MATRTITVLVDDTDGRPATQTVGFGLDGVTYEIDLSQENADQLRELLEPYIQSGRRTGGRRKAPRVHPDPMTVVQNAASEDSSADQDAEKIVGRGGRKNRPHGARSGRGKASGQKVSGKTTAKRGGKAAAKTDGGRQREIREWAEANGYEVSSRGRIPGSVVEAYGARDQAAERAESA